MEYADSCLVQSKTSGFNADFRDAGGLNLKFIGKLDSWTNPEFLKL